MLEIFIIFMDFMSFMLYLYFDKSVESIIYALNLPLILDLAEVKLKSL